MKIISKKGSISLFQIGSCYFVENCGIGIYYSEDFKKADRVFKKTLSYYNC